jgi:dienelactone hydrolase
MNQGGKMRVTNLLLLFVFFVMVGCSTEKKAEETTMQESVIHTEEITYSADEVNLKGYLAYDESIKEARPGVLVVHEWWGHNAYARKRAEMLAGLGYTALAVDMYGDGKQAGHPEDAQKFAQQVMQNIKSGEARFQAALNLLKKHPTTDSTKIAAIGYCFGGGIVLHMARVGMDLDGVVSFHGSIGSMHTPEPGSVKAQVLVLNGADDPFVTTEQIETFKKEMGDAGVQYEFVSYPGAKHSFTNPMADSVGAEYNLPLAYNKEADEKSWAKMQQFFKTIFK